MKYVLRVYTTPVFEGDCACYEYYCAAEDSRCPVDARSFDSGEAAIFHSVDEARAALPKFMALFDEDYAKDLIRSVEVHPV